MSHQFQYTFDFEKGSEEAKSSKRQSQNQESARKVHIKPFDSVIEQLGPNSEEYSYELTPSPPNEHIDKEIINNKSQNVRDFDEELLLEEGDFSKYRGHHQAKINMQFED